MNFGTHMMGHQPDDTLGLRRREPLVRFGHATVETVYPKPTIGVEHDLGDLRLIALRGS